MSPPDSEPPPAGPMDHPGAEPAEQALPAARDPIQRAHRVPRGFPERGRFLRLDLGEDDAPASPMVAQRLAQLDPSVYAHYPDVYPLRERLAELHGVEVDWISITAGTDEAIRLIFRSFVEEGSRVLLPRPSSGGYLAAAESAGAFVERVDYADDLSFPIEQLRRQMLARRPRVVVLGNPGSPTGTAIDIETLLALPSESPPSLFVIDEVYASYHGRSVLDVDLRPRLPANAIVVRSFSKDYGLAGLRVGYLVGRPELLRAIAVVKPSYTIGAPSLHAAIASLDDRASMLARVRGRRALSEALVAALAVRGVEARSTRSAFVLVRLSAPIQDWAAAFAAHHVLIGTRGHVGALTPWVRITVTSQSEIERFLEVLDLVLQEGLGAASSERAVPGDWDERLEGLA